MNIKKLVAKIKSIKNVELYVALVLGVIVLAVVLATSSANTDKSLVDTTDFDAYISALENKISSVLGKMDGCGNVKVAISYSSVDEKEYAYETVVSGSGANAKKTTTVVKVNGQPLVVKNLTPEITGVVVVADGANDPAVRVKIKQVVVTLLGVSIDKVQVFTYKR